MLNNNKCFLSLISSVYTQHFSDCLYKDFNFPSSYQIKWYVVLYFFLFPLPHLAVLQGQFEHLCCAADQPNPNAVHHHSFAAAEDYGGQVLRLYFTDELPKAGCDRVLGDWVLQDCRGKSKTHR